MSLPFLDRQGEEKRLRRFLTGSDGRLAVLYGRRRTGKSTLLQRVSSPHDLYFVADLRERPLQLQALAEEGERLLPGLAAGRYSTWDDLLRALHGRVTGRLNLILDEFPYLVANAPELPSLIQAHIDQAGSSRLRFLLCGSSQRMMQGLVLDRTAPLYGRAQELLKLEPLPAGWIQDALGIHGPDAIEAYAVWGGMPHYWELARPYDGLVPAVDDLLLDRLGVLHDEPAGLLLDDLRTAGQAYSLLSLIGGGCHRLSEIAGRLGKPAGSLTRPLSQLIELGYVSREVPFGESERSSKRTIYRLDDPFLAFHFRFVQPARSLLALGRTGPVRDRVKAELAGHVARVWEALARRSVPFLGLGDTEWGPASRWWRGDGPELDVVAESLDGKRVLVGEAKWSSRDRDARAELARLRERIAAVPVLRDRDVVLALWRREGSSSRVRGAEVVLPKHVLSTLR